MTILPSSYLEKCPHCGLPMSISPIIGLDRTTCVNCDYKEPSGNPIAITFISACFSQYASDLNLDTVFLKDSQFTIRECMEGNGLLPLFVERALEIQTSAGFDAIPGIGINLNVVEDGKGLLRSRVVLGNNPFNIASSMFFLTEVLHEQINLTRKLSKKFYGNQLCLDYLPSLNPSIGDFSSTSDDLQRILVKATKQQTFGAPGVKR